MSQTEARTRTFRQRSSQTVPPVKPNIGKRQFKHLGSVGRLCKENLTLILIAGAAVAVGVGIGIPLQNKSSALIDSLNQTIGGIESATPPGEELSNSQRNEKTTIQGAASPCCRKSRFQSANPNSNYSKPTCE